jgi:hypothetical protein
MSAECAAPARPAATPAGPEYPDPYRLAGNVGNRLARKNAHWLAAYVTPAPALDPIVVPAEWEPQPFTITDRRYSGTEGDWLSDAEIEAIHAAWDERAWLAVCEGTRWGTERPVPQGAPADGRKTFAPGHYEPVSARSEDDTLLPADVPVLTAEVIATEEARRAAQQEADDAARAADDAVQAEAAAALKRAGASGRDLAEIGRPGDGRDAADDGRDAADDGTETFDTVHPPVIL